jgi:hypothetical protein
VGSPRQARDDHTKDGQQRPVWLTIARGHAPRFLSIGGQQQGHREQPDNEPADRTERRPGGHQTTAVLLDLEVNDVPKRLRLPTTM